jgi:hypothetical protein
MTEVGKNGKVSFETEGLIFYHLLKSRENDMGYDDIFIHELYPRVEKTVQAATKTEYIAKSAKNEWESLFKGGEEEQKITPNKNYSVEDFNDLPF